MLRLDSAERCGMVLCLYVVLHLLFSYENLVFWCCEKMRSGCLPCLGLEEFHVVCFSVSMIELCCKLYFTGHMVLLNFEVLDVIEETIFKVTFLCPMCWKHSLKGTAA